MGSLIERLEPYYPNLEKHNSKYDYHALTRGYITNEIVRRIDPKQRTIDEIFKEDVKIDGIHITVDEKAKKDLVPENFITLGYTLGQSILPKWAGRKIENDIFSFIRMLGFFAYNAIGKRQFPAFCTE